MYCGLLHEENVATLGDNPIALSSGFAVHNVVGRWGYRLQPGGQKLLRHESENHRILAVHVRHSILGSSHEIYINLYCRNEGVLKLTGRIPSVWSPDCDSTSKYYCSIVSIVVGSELPAFKVS